MIAKPFSPRLLLSQVRAVIGPVNDDQEGRKAA
jgi:DNA-binding response OmpR family regulator